MTGASARVPVTPPPAPPPSFNNPGDPARSGPSPAQKARVWPSPDQRGGAREEDQQDAKYLPALAKDPDRAVAARGSSPLSQKTRVWPSLDRHGRNWARGRRRIARRRRLRGSAVKPGGREEPAASTAVLLIPLHMLPPHSCRARPHHRHHRNQQNVARQSSYFRPSRAARGCTRVQKPGPRARSARGPVFCTRVHPRAAREGRMSVCRPPGHFPRALGHFFDGNF